MGLFFYDKIDRDFPGGLYLPPLGNIPVADCITPLAARQRLRLPLYIGMHRLEPCFTVGQKLRRGELLARKNEFRVYIPCDGIVTSVSKAWVDGRVKTLKRQEYKTEFFVT